MAQRLDRPLVLVECGPDDHPLQAQHLKAHRQLCPSIQFVRLGGAKPVSEEIKHQALAAADVAVSLVDNPQETFGLSVAEAMAAGVPLVVSDWDGYRDLVRDGIDGFRVPTRWASVAQPASVPLGWQQLLGLEPYPKVAGALGQLVHFDTQAAEAACLTLLTRSELRRAMGAAARQRANETFHPDVVMSQIEALFLDLQDRRQQAAAAPAASVPSWIWCGLLLVMPPQERLARFLDKILRNFLFPCSRSSVRGRVVGSSEGVFA